MIQGLVSVGVPVYNGEKYLNQTLESLLSQDYKNLEVIISDNASTDRTGDICQEYAARDKRVRYSRNSLNMGSVKNFNQVFELSSGQYFMWAGAHDLWDRSYISCCIDILEGNPRIVLAYSQTMLIDSKGKCLEVTPDSIDTRGLDTLQRYEHVIWNLSWCNMLHGLIRRDVLAKTDKLRIIWGSDFALLAELALMGEYAQLKMPLFYRRMNRQDESPEAHKKRVLQYLDPSIAERKSKISFEDLWVELRNAHLRVLIKAPLNLLEKLQAIIATIVCFKSRFNTRGRVLLLTDRMVSFFKPKSILRRIRSLYKSYLL